MYAGLLILGISTQSVFSMNKVGAMSSLLFLLYWHSYRLVGG